MFCRSIVGNGSINLPLILNTKYIIINSLWELLGGQCHFFAGAVSYIPLTLEIVKLKQVSHSQLSQRKNLTIFNSNQGGQRQDFGTVIERVLERRRESWWKPLPFLTLPCLLCPPLLFLPSCSPYCCLPPLPSSDK